MEKTVGHFITQDAAILKGRQFWEDEYLKLLKVKSVLVNKIMVECAGMEDEEVLEDFAILQVNDFIRSFRSWIDDTFKPDIV